MDETSFVITINQHGTKVYEGTPCKKFGHTIRYAASKACVACDELRRQDPQEKAKALAREALPENKQKRLEYSRRPQNKARAAIVKAAYLADPEVLKRKAIAQAEYDRQPSAKAQRRAYSQRPKTRAKIAEYDALPERQLSRYLYRYTERGKAVLRAIGSKMRAKRSGAKGSHTADEWQSVKERYGNRCLHCGKHESECGKLQRDHVIPLVPKKDKDKMPIHAPGTDYVHNLQPLCGPCNILKRNNLGFDFRPLWTAPDGTIRRPLSFSSNRR